MNTGSNYARRSFKAAVLSVALVFSVCAASQPTEDPTKELNLAKTPIGLHVQKVGTAGGMTYCDITVRNNSGKFIEILYVEVRVYDGELRVGMTNEIFKSVNVGETMVTRQPINSSGRQWDDWKYAYGIR